MIANRQFRRTTAAVAAVAACLLLAAACSGGSSGDSSAGDAARDVASGSAREPATDGAGADPGKANENGTRVDPAVVSAQTQSEHIARNAMLALKVKAIGNAAASVRAISATHGGMVLSENIGSTSGEIVPLDDPTRVTATTYGEITISVPADRLDRALTDLSEVGTVIRRETSSENVHDEYVDTESRVKTMQASVNRVRALMSQATDIAQIVALESELSRRQADLEALESQLASLKDRVAHSPVRISLTTDAAVIAEEPDTGFLVGLKGGWDAFTSSVVMVLTVVGAVLPFAVAAAAIGLPLWLGLRRRRAHQPPAASLPLAE
jgi:hypothetical protein